MSATRPQLGGAVYDRGYRPYDGPRGGRRQARFALWRLTVRRALGIRRSWRQKVLPWSLLGLSTLPAVIDVGVRWATRNTLAAEIDFEFLTFREYVGVSTMLLLFVAVSAPDVVAPDRHDRVLPLIFARPLSGGDYVFAKVGGIFAIVFGFSFLPQVLLYLGQLLVSDSALDYFTSHGDVLWQVPVAVGLLALYYASTSVAVASLTDRRIVGGLAFLGVMLVPSVVAGVFVSTASPDGTPFALVSLLDLPLFVRDLVFEGRVDVDDEGGLAGVAGGGLAACVVYAGVVSGAIALLLRRYREVRL